MAKFKYLRGGRVFESDKIYNLPTIGPDGKLSTVDPNKPKTPKATTKPVSTGPKYTPPNPKTTPEMNKIHATNNLNMAVRFKNMLKGVNKTIAGADDINTGGFAGSIRNTSANQYVDIDPAAIVRADSVINATRPIVFPPNFGSGGIAEYGVSTQTDRQGRKGKQYADGGIDTNRLQQYTDPLVNFKKRNVTLAPPMQTATPITSNPVSSGRDFNSILGSTAPFLDNIANLAATNRTPSIPTPTYTSAPRLNTTVNINPQLKKINEDTTAAGMGIDRSTSSAGVANANKGQLLANKWRATGELHGNKQNMESQLQNQASMADYQARRSNDALTNQTNLNQMQRTDDINQRYAGVVSDFGSDISNINRERNQMSLDKERFKMLMKINPDAAYQFADTSTFSDLYKDDEPGLRKLILTQRGTETKAALAKLYKRLYNKDFSE